MYSTKAALATWWHPHKGGRQMFSTLFYFKTCVDSCIQCTKRSVFERSVLECGASKLFFDFFSDYPLDAVASERAFSSIFDVSRLRGDHVRSLFDVWRLRSEHFR